jgi:hypothetical protein
VEVVLRNIPVDRQPEVTCNLSFSVSTIILLSPKLTMPVTHIGMSQTTSHHDVVLPYAEGQSRSTSLPTLPDPSPRPFSI